MYGRAAVPWMEEPGEAGEALDREEPPTGGGLRTYEEARGELRREEEAWEGGEECPRARLESARLESAISIRRMLCTSRLAESGGGRPWRRA